MGYGYSASPGISIFTVLGVIIFIVYLFSTAFFTGWLAKKKGYSGGLWGILGFFFGIFALLTIGFAPINTISKNYIGSGKFENNNKRWKCPKCNSDNPNSTYQCGSCGYKLV